MVIVVCIGGSVLYSVFKIQEDKEIN